MVVMAMAMAMAVMMKAKGKALKAGGRGLSGSGVAVASVESKAQRWVCWWFVFRSGGNKQKQMTITACCLSFLLAVLPVWWF